MIPDLSESVPSQDLLGDVSGGINTLSGGTAPCSTSALPCPFPESDPELQVFGEPKHDPLLMSLCRKSLMFHCTLGACETSLCWGRWRLALRAGEFRSRKRVWRMLRCSCCLAGNKLGLDDFISILGEAQKVCSWSNLLYLTLNCVVCVPPQESLEFKPSLATQVDVEHLNSICTGHIRFLCIKHHLIFLLRVCDLSEVQKLFLIQKFREHRH